MRGERRWLDPALAAALTALGLAMTFDPGNGDGTVVDSFVIGTVTIPVAWRSRAPLAAAAALAMGTVVSAVPTFDQTRCGVAIPATLLILFSVATRRELGEAVAGLVLLLAGLVFLLFTDPELDAGALFFVPLCAGVWAAGRVVRSRSRIAAGLELAAYRAIQHGLEALGGAPASVRLRYLPDALELEVRGTLADDGQAALAAARERVAAHGGEFSARRGMLRARLPAEVEEGAYRLVQEGLTNAMKHAPGSTVDLRLSVQAGALEIELRDSGARASSKLAATGSGLGLSGMRKRIEALGGELDAGPVSGGGWRLRAHVPTTPTV